MVLDFRGRAVLLPVFLDGADAVGADGDDLLDLVLGEGFEVGFGELLKDQVVAKAADGVAGALFLAQDAVAGAEVIHHAGEVGHDLAAFGVVSAHAAKPQAIFLRAVEDGQFLLGNEFVALGGV